MYYATGTKIYCWLNEGRFSLLSVEYFDDNSEKRSDKYRRKVHTTRRRRTRTDGPFSTRMSVAVLFVAFLLVQKNRAGFTLPGQLFSASSGELNL